MLLEKKWWHLRRILIQAVVRAVNTRVVAWSIVLLLSLLFLFPYTLHGLTVWTLGPYTIMSLLPIVVGSLLRSRSGALVAWFLTMGGLLVLVLAGLEATWVGWQFALPCIAISELLIALIAGQQRSLSMQLSHAYKKLEEAHTRSQVQALTDGLTGLPNHGAIVTQIEAELLQCRNNQRNCTIIFADVDHFKYINDTWGHAAGDAALRLMGQRLREGVRKNDSVGRYGGEEFVIMLSDIGPSQAYDRAERLRRSIAENPCLWQAEATQPTVTIPLTTSLGLATYPLDGLTASELLDVADAAMYVAKHTGRNRVCLSDGMSMAQLKEKTLQASGYSEQSVLQTISTMAAFHNQGTQAHANRMIELAEATMRALGRSEDEVMLIRLAAQVHDIGKIGISTTILDKPGPLSEDEWDAIRRHPQIGQQILKEAKGHLGLVSHIIVAHHERWDGKGYPYQLAQQEIPLGARILSVIDAYDAMISPRPYREALSVPEAQAELRRCVGSQFDPQVVETFLQVIQARESQASSIPTFVSNRPQLKDR